MSVLAALPGSSYITGAPKPYKVIFFYLVLLLVIICVFLRRRKLTIRSLKSENAYANGMQEVYVREQKSIDRIMKQTHLGQGIVMLLLLLLLLVPAGQEDCITFLDVGQGDGICMELEDEVYLIDCGSTSERGIGNYTLLPYLKYRGIREIDGWFLTHPDEDHVSAFAELCMENNMGGIAVKKLFLPAVLQEEFREIADLAKQNNIEIVWLAYGDSLETGEGMLFVLSPVQSGAYADTNAASLVLLLQYNSFTGLFMGDAGTVAEEHIRGMEISDITLLKVGHHGSRIEANAKDFIMQMNPKIAVISCERNNVYGHPHREVTERLKMTGSSILITAEHGAITVELSEDGELRVRGMY